MTRAAVFALAAFVCATPAAAATQRPDPCARFEEPLAYNACLAEHGPRAPATRPATESEEGGGPARRAPHGRQRLEFNAGD